MTGNLLTFEIDFSTPNHRSFVVCCKVGLSTDQGDSKYYLFLFTGSLSFTFYSSGSPNIHKYILQVGLCATLYQMY